MKVIFDMIELIALVMLILFVVYLLFTFLSYASLFLNIVILIALVFLILKDLKDKGHHKYYVTSLFITALMFIFSGTGFISNLLILTEKLLLSSAIVAVIAVYFFANIISYTYEFYDHLKKKLKK
jgi:hypothetical protein